MRSIRPCTSTWSHRCADNDRNRSYLSRPSGSIFSRTAAIGGIGCFHEAIRKEVCSISGTLASTPITVRHRSAEEMGANCKPRCTGCFRNCRTRRPTMPGESTDPHARRRENAAAADRSISSRTASCRHDHIRSTAVAGAGFVGFLFAAVFGLDIEIPGRQLREHIFVAFEDIADRKRQVVYQQDRVVRAASWLVFENLVGEGVVEVCGRNTRGFLESIFESSCNAAETDSATPDCVFRSALRNSGRGLLSRAYERA